MQLTPLSRRGTGHGMVRIPGMAGPAAVARGVDTRRHGLRPRRPDCPPTAAIAGRRSPSGLGRRWSGPRSHSGSGPPPSTWIDQPERRVSGLSPRVRGNPDRFTSAVGPRLRGIPPPAERVKEPSGGCSVAAIQHWGQVQRMPGAAGTAFALRKIVAVPDLSLKPGIHLADVVQCSKDTQPRYRYVIKVCPTRGICQPLPNHGML